MATVSTSERDNVITRAPFLSESVGEMVAWHDVEGPAIDIHLEPLDSGQRVDLSITPAEARMVAGQLAEIAAIAQRAGWTPAVLAEVRERFLPGLSDEQIIERLDALADRLDGGVLGHRGHVDWRAGRMLVAQTGAELLDRADAAVGEAERHLAGYRQAVERLGAVKAELDQVRRFYRAESEVA